MDFIRKIPPMKELFVERMKMLLLDEKDFQNYLEILKIHPVKSIRCNTLKISPLELKRKLEEKGWKIRQPWKNNPEVMIVEGKICEGFSLSRPPTQDCNLYSLVDIGKKSLNKKIVNVKNNVEQLTILNRKSSSLSTLNKSQGKAESFLQDIEPGEVGRALEHQLGYYYMQELASMLPVIALESKKNDLILDLCAAPGSKTTQLSSEMKGTGTIIANEVSMGRLKILASNLEKCGASNTIITRKDGFAFCKRLVKFNPEIKFDRILVDAPCSGEGTLRSSFKTYKMWNIKTIQNLPKIQKALVESAFEILKSNGVLVYSTCTHAPEENEEVVDAILEKFGDKIKLEKIELPIKIREGITEWENMKFSKEVKKCARIYPQDNDTEGFFIAKFRRVK